MKDRIDKLSRSSKVLILAFIDYIIAIISLYLVSYILDKNLNIMTFLKENYLIIFIMLFVVIISSNITKVSSTAIRNLYFTDATKFIFYSILVSCITYILSFFIVINFTLITFFYYVSSLLLGMILTRLCIFYMINISHSIKINNPKSRKTRLAIFGAGSAGRNIINLLHEKEYNILALIDDGAGFTDTYISGIKIFSRNSFKKNFSYNKPDEIWVVIPSASNREFQSIIEYLSQFEVKIKKIPSLNELLLSGKSIINPVEINPLDVLGRKKVNIDKQLFKSHYFNKSILISGAGGSIGSEIAKQLLTVQPNKVIFLDISEYSLYRLEKDIENQTGNEVITKYFLCSILNKKLLGDIIRKEKIQVIIHAAAYKHVPIIEENTVAGFRNNVIGTINIVDEAILNNIERFIFVSTDKAVRPTSIMGATKRMAELVIQHKLSEINNIETAIVRFGNVLGSSGSVIPLFKKQIKSGGPITLTDPEMTRYFMVIEEAAQLVLLAGSFGGKGEVYLLDMGEQVKIVDLIKNMLKLEGLKLKDSQNLDGDIEIKVINKRRGEKLFEELLINKDDKHTSHPKVRVANEKINNKEQMHSFINSIFSENNLTHAQVVRILEDHISEFKYNN